MMDLIAAETAFFPPLFRPILEAELNSHGILTFECIQAVRERFRPEASFQATALAAIKQTSYPLVYLQGRMGLKKQERELLLSPQLNMFPDARPKEKLRVISPVSNDKARQIGLRVNPNMRIPESSIVTKVYQNGFGGNSVTGWENLACWTHSDGSHLIDLDVFVEAKLINEDLIQAIISVIDPQKNNQ